MLEEEQKNKCSTHNELTMISKNLFGEFVIQIPDLAKPVCTTITIRGHDILNLFKEL
jgi:hypothetical protein